MADQGGKRATSQVSDGLQDLEERIERVNVAVSDLITKIGPVLGPEPNESGVTLPEDMTEESELARLLGNLDERVRYIQNRIADALYRVEV